MEQIQVISKKVDCILENLHLAKESLLSGHEIITLENLNLESTIAYLKTKGCPISKSKLYKLTSTSSIPFYRFGNKLIFKKSEIDIWCESKVIKNSHSNESVTAISNSAIKKIYNVKN